MVRWLISSGVISVDVLFEVILVWISGRLIILIVWI